MATPADSEEGGYDVSPQTSLDSPTHRADSPAFVAD
eukprot:gene9528-8519_t